MCPNNLWQAMVWFYSFMPGYEDLYMVGIAVICWAIWKTRNKVTFDKHKMRTPCEVMFLSSAFLMYWAGLQKEQGREKLQFGAAKMMEKAAGLLRSRNGNGGMIVPLSGAIGSGV
jgi:hypothetical protein